MWPAESPADTHHCLGGQLRGGAGSGMVPRNSLLQGEGVAGTEALKTYGCLAKDRTLGTNIPLLCACLEI